MSTSLKSRLQQLREGGLATAFSQLNRGIEKEGLRVDANGFIAQTDHPRGLGHALTHPFITTDYSEALLELITPVLQSTRATLDELTAVHQFVQQQLHDEWIWPASMPCRLDGDESIRIAEYGESNLGKLKHVYRHGLWHRYGRVMQAIAGMHYNFSLPDAYFTVRREQLGGRISAQALASQEYFDLIRNFRRYGWMLLYLFGASPVADASFVAGLNHQLQPLGDDWHLPYATSLRMSDLGYTSKAQSSLNICFNRIESYTEALHRAIHTPHPAYEKIGVEVDGVYRQLNTSILQVENEYYSVIRPKRVGKSGQKPIDALRDGGVQYIEVRCLDLNPFEPAGICFSQMHFMDVFLTYCLLEDSPYISDEACIEVDRNFQQVITRGRQPGLQLQHDGQPISLTDWGLELCQRMAPVAEWLDHCHASACFSQSLELQVQKLKQPELTPAHRVLQTMQEKQQSFAECGMDLARSHRATLLETAPPDWQRFTRASEQSFDDEAAVRASDTCGFAQYLTEYLK